MIDAVWMDNYHFSTINYHLKRQGQPCVELLLSSARIAYKLATPAIPPFSKDTMKEGAMCLGYFCDKFRVLSSPTRYHLLFKTYQQAAMHWVTSKLIDNCNKPPMQFPLAFQKKQIQQTAMC